VNGSLLLISKHPQDVTLCSGVATRLQLDFKHTTSINEVRSKLIEDPRSVVFWDAETATGYERIAEVLPKYTSPKRVFAVTSKGFGEYPHLFNNPDFRNHVFRQYDASAEIVLSCVVAAAIAPGDSAVRIETFFPKPPPIKRIFITRPAHRTAAIEAINNSLTKHGIKDRMAALVARCTDELILNAVLRAPVWPDGSPKRASAERDQNFEFITQEQVEVEVAEGESYMAVCVSDLFGSLKRRAILDALREHYESSAPKNVRAGVRIGFHMVVEGGLSLVVSTQPKQQTRVILLFPKVESYKQFRMGFRFLSLNAE